MLSEARSYLVSRGNIYKKIPSLSQPLENACYIIITVDRGLTNLIPGYKTFALADPKWGGGGGC